MLLTFLTLALPILCLYGVEAALLQSPAEIPTNTTFDYIIVGGKLGP